MQLRAAPSRFTAGVSLLFLLRLTASAQFDHFVTRSGDTLLDGDRALRFISFNTPNLHYLEDELPFGGTNPWRLPNAYEIRDALNTVKECGGKVTRIYVLSVRRQDDAPGVIRHVEAPGVFNEAAFRTLDTVLCIANDVGIRIIVPFVDNWQWWGGPLEYAAFRGKPKEAFWTDPRIIEDFKGTIRYLLTRRNTCTGVPYSEDKAILAWETGNEISPPQSWTREIAAYVKSLDHHHLLMDGMSIRTLSEEALSDTNIDIVTTHHYGPAKASLEYIVRNAVLARGRKPYVIGEYGIVPLQDIRAITDTIIRQGLAGGMIWSLRFHNRDGGFYSHYEYANTEGYRWPGFANGDPYHERMVLDLLREKAYEIDGAVAPRIPPPDPPLLLPIHDPSAISWQGSTGAQWYRLDRRRIGDTAWTVLDGGVDDSRVQYRPLFDDTSAVPGNAYEYRVRAANESGVSEWSNVAGPVTGLQRVLVDEMGDFAEVFQKDGPLRLLTFEDIRKAREDRTRLTGDDGSYVMYKLPAPASGARVEWLMSTPSAGVEILVSGDGLNFAAVQTRQDTFHMPRNDYAFYDAVASSAGTFPPAVRFVKIVLHGKVQIGRVEIPYDRLPGK